MKNKAYLFLFLSLLTGCSGKVESGNYRCYLGKMMVSSFILPKEEIQDKKIQTAIKGDYYGNIYSLGTQKERMDFFTKYSAIEEEEKKKNVQLKESLMAIYFIIDTPKGFKAVKRDNIQGTLVDQGLTLLTDNFYYYASRTDLFYLSIDLKKDDSITKDGIYSFYYVTSAQYKDKLKEENIRLLYHLV